MTPAEYVDGVIATERGRDLMASHSAASDILAVNGIDPLDANARRLVAIGAVIGSTFNDPNGLVLDGFVRSLTYGMEASA